MCYHAESLGCVDSTVVTALALGGRVCAGVGQRGRNSTRVFLEDLLNAGHENPAFKITSVHCDVWLAFVQRFKKRQYLFKQFTFGIVMTSHRAQPSTLNAGTQLA